MAVGSDYDGSKIQPVIRDGQIRVTAEWLTANAVDKSDEADKTLKASLLSWSVCPKAYRFKDTPDVRRILGIASERARPAIYELDPNGEATGRVHWFCTQNCLVIFAGDPDGAIESEQTALGSDAEWPDDTICENCGVAL
jgi:hypothetical protein